MVNNLRLPLIKVIPRQHLIRQPVTPDDGDKFAATLSEVRFRQLVGKTLANHHERAGAVFFDVTGEEECLAKPMVARDGAVGMAQAFGCQRAPDVQLTFSLPLRFSLSGS